MRKLSFFAVSCCLLVAGSIAMGDWANPTNGWEAQYDASLGYNPESNSTTPKWTKYYYDAYVNCSSALVDDATLGHKVLALTHTIPSTGTGNGRYGNYTLTTGYGSGSSTDLITMDFQMQLADAAQTSDTPQFQLAIVRDTAGTDDTQWYFRFAQDRIYTNSGEVSINLGLNWNAFRVLIDVANNKAWLYVNGSSTALISDNLGTKPSAAGALTKFGDGTGVVVGKANLSYLKWTNSELAPVPEPTSMILLGVGGLLGIFYKRKR